MVQFLGICLLGVGIFGSIYEWIMRQRNRKRRMDNLLDFLRTISFTMEESNIFWIPFLEEYVSEDEAIQEVLYKLLQNLKENKYPKGELAWQEAIKGCEEQWDFSKESMELLYGIGKGFFGKSRKENLEIIHMYMHLLQECKEKEQKEFAEKKKVWIPVTLLGGIMLVIVLI